MLKKDKPYLGSYEDAPAFIRKNKYLLTGYRINYSSIKLATQSILQAHNETGNIWTHLIPAICCIYVIMIDDLPLIKHDHQLTLWPIKYSLLCGIYLFSISTIFHTYICVNSLFCCVLLRLDYSGICLIASAATIPIIQYGFYCNPEIQDMYVSLVFGICSFVWLVSLMNFMHKQEFVVQKSIIYFIFFAIVFIPLFHLIFLYRLGLLGEHFSLINIEYAFILSTLPLSIGLFVYTYRVPERWYPKKYDIWGNSHTIWHILTVIVYVLSYYINTEAYNQRSKYLCA